MKNLSLIALLVLVTQSIAFASPACLDGVEKNIPVNNAQVLKWKATEPNLFLARSHVSGVVSDIYPDRNGHNHFAIALDSTPGHTLEVVYNISFGELPSLKIGAKIEACGDFIQSFADAQYPASPNGAIIHWIHRNPSGHGHPSGYLLINGTLYGQGNGFGS